MVSIYVGARFYEARRLGMHPSASRLSVEAISPPTVAVRSCTRESYLHYSIEEIRREVNTMSRFRYMLDMGRRRDKASEA